MTWGLVLTAALLGGCIDHIQQAPAEEGSAPPQQDGGQLDPCHPEGFDSPQCRADQVCEDGSCVPLDRDRHCVDQNPCRDGPCFDWPPDAIIDCGPAPCTGDASCADSIYGRFCHPTDRFCVGCYEDAHCTDLAHPVCSGETRSCDRAPLPGCLEDITCCPADRMCEMRCDRSRRPAVCAEGLQCYADYDCFERAGRYCFDEDEDPTTPGQCRTRCDQGGACPVGFECSPEGSCEQSHCTSDDECAPPARCLELARGESFCRQSECTVDQDCVDLGLGAVCDELVPGFGSCGGE